MIKQWSFEETPGAVSAAQPTLAVLPGANIGLIGLEHSVAPPEGYEYLDELTDVAAAHLLRDHYPVPDKTEEDWRQDQVEFMNDRGSIIHVALAEKNTGETVGMGVLSYLGQQGVLSNFVVHKDHRGRDIGKTIIDERLALAKQLRLAIVGVPLIAETNTLKTYYEERGFMRVPGGQLMYSPYLGSKKISGVDVVGPTAWR